jgi:hypothetical protein
MSGDLEHGGCRIDACDKSAVGQGCRELACTASEIED